MSESEHRCIICNQITVEGIRLRGKLICTKCEREIVNAEVGELAYQSYKQGVKALWGDLKTDRIYEE